MLSNQSQDISSPCIRNCCLDNDDICLGCYRHIDEITGWTAFSVLEKQKTLARCQQRKAKKELRISG